MPVDVPDRVEREVGYKRKWWTGCGMVYEDLGAVSECLTVGEFKDLLTLSG
jgi:hypothetical protein